ncbi:MAG TPA: polymer-forming cytoskeletal protein [Steroidobacteraceae bacterium]|nr:polymer-forming cytoskeletal protein [Steroidobacteraceae bacterium]
MAETSRVLESAARDRPSTPEERLAMLRELKGTKSSTDHRERRATGDGKQSVLGRTLRFKGDLTADEDLVIQGSIEGSIKHTQSLTIGVDGSMIGDIHARTIVVEGTVEGDLYGTESVTVRATGRVRGSIFAPTVSLAEGSAFNGRIEMDLERKPAKQTTTQTKPTAPEPAVTQQSIDDTAVDQMLGS